MSTYTPTTVPVLQQHQRSAETYSLVLQQNLWSSDDDGDDMAGVQS